MKVTPESEAPIIPNEDEGEINADFYNIKQGNIEETVVPKANVNLIKAHAADFDDFTQKRTKWEIHLYRRVVRTEFYKVLSLW